MGDSSDQRKVIIRKLPAQLGEEDLKSTLATWLPSTDWFLYYPGKLSKNRLSRAYLRFTTTELALNFIKEFNGHVFLDVKGNQYKAEVEPAPFQKIPSTKKKPSSVEGTIEEDPDYIAFAERMTKGEPDENIRPQENLPSTLSPLVEAIVAKRARQSAKKTRNAAKNKDLAQGQDKKASKKRNKKDKQRPAKEQKPAETAGPAEQAATAPAVSTPRPRPQPGGIDKPPRRQEREVFVPRGKREESEDSASSSGSRGRGKAKRGGRGKKQHGDAQQPPQYDARTTAPKILSKPAGGGGGGGGVLPLLETPGPATTPAASTPLPSSQPRQGFGSNGAQAAPFTPGQHAHSSGSGGSYHGMGGQLHGAYPGYHHGGTGYGGGAGYGGGYGGGYAHGQGAYGGPGSGGTPGYGGATYNPSQQYHQHAAQFGGYPDPRLMQPAPRHQHPR